MHFKRKYQRRIKLNKFNFGRIIPLFLLFLIFFTFGFSNSNFKTWNFNWNGIRSEIKDSILKFKWRQKIVTLPNEMSDSREINTQNWIRINTSTDELTKLIKYPDSYVRAISYDALLRRPSINKYIHIKNVLNDTLSYIVVYGGCFRNDISIAEYILKQQLGFGTIRPRKSFKIEDQLTIEQVKEIDSLFKSFKKKEGSYKYKVFGDDIPITNYIWH